MNNGKSKKTLTTAESSTARTERLAKAAAKRVSGAVRKQDSLTQSAAVIAGRKKHTFDDLQFMTKGLVQTTLPHTKTDERTLEKKNGDARLMMTALDPRLKLPYGIYPRLTMLWLCTEILRLTGQGKDCKTICLGKSFADFTRKIGVVGADGNPSQVQHDYVRYQLECLLSTAFLFCHKGVLSHDGGVCSIAKNWSLWPARGEKRTPAFITLNDWFIDEVLKWSVPFDINAIREFRRSSMDLDVLMWATWRFPKPQSKNRKGQGVELAYKALADQFGSGYAKLNEFKYRLIESLDKLKILWPALRYEAKENGLVIYHTPRMVSAKHNPLKDYETGEKPASDDTDEFEYD